MSYTDRCIVFYMNKTILVGLIALLSLPGFCLAKLSMRATIRGKLWPGRKIGRRLQVIIKNRGDKILEDVTLNLFLSKHRQEQAKSKDLLLGQTSVPRIAYGKPTKVRFPDSLQLPKKLAYGRYFLRLTLATKESLLALRPIRIGPPPPPKPDLEARIRLTEKGPFAPGTKMVDKIVVEIRNKGKVPSTTPFSVDVLLSKSERVDYDRIPAIYRTEYKDDCLLKGGREIVRHLAPGPWQKLELRGTLEIPIMKRWPPNFIGVVIDSADSVIEEDEANNVAFAPIKVPGQKKVRPLWGR